MKALIIYCSDYRGNTEKIAYEIASKIDAEILNIKDFKNDAIDIEEYTLIGFGSGIYRETISHKLYGIVDGLDLGGKDTFVFSTSGVGMKFYNIKLTRLLKKKGAIVLGSFACKGSFTASEFTDKKIFNIFGNMSQGHPDKNDMVNAERFITDFINKI
ncbi:flavodoxin family protein [Gudongella sp. DL1XJH-153]|uniref:flavodoxin family protein n=1 Tax=Gudongella sp. DL1XJH-153 TaxID=3409804 RepID=UPI003BB7CF41